MSRHRGSPSPRPLQSVTPLPRQISREISRGGYLESQTLGVVLLVAAGLVIAGWCALAWRRRAKKKRLLPGLPRWVANLLAGLLTCLLVIAGIAVLVNAYVGYVPTLQSLFSPPGTTSVAPRHGLPGFSNADRSRIVRIEIPGAAYGMPTGAAYVYLPPGYDQPANAGRRYPVVYLIHGYPGRAEDWFTAGGVKKAMDLLLAHHYVGPMIVVSPTASSGYLNDDECLNSVGRLRVEDYLVYAVPAAVDRTFRTLAVRSERAIGGMSSGGYCALNVGLHHLHRFSLILASEPYGDPGTHAFRRMLDHSLALLAVNSPSTYLPDWRFPLPVDVFLDSGSRDLTTTSSSYRLARALADHGQLVAYRAVSSVGHNWREARRALPYALIFAWQHFGTLPNGGSDLADQQRVDDLLSLYAKRLQHRHQRAQPPSPSASPAGSPTPATTSPAASSPSRPPSKRPSPSPTSSSRSP